MTASQLAIPDTIFERSSRATLDDEKSLLPRLPTNLVPGEPFQCHYCCNIVELPDTAAWQKHVHADLSSYTCVFENCDEMLFGSRHKWWAHEMETHRQQWVCAICKSVHTSFASMKNHLKDVHSDNISSEQFNDVARRFGRPLTHLQTSDCPLCDYPTVLRRRGYSEKESQFVTAEKFGQHLGRHLEQLSLFVLPTADLVYAEDHVSDGDENDDRDVNDSGDDEGGDTTVPPLSELDLVQQLFKEAALQHPGPEHFDTPPDLTMGWQPPQDFTPPQEDFDTDDGDALPVRQDPIFGGDLHTSGWTRGTGSRKEGFCGRCPLGNWLKISDGSYRFNLTYFHGVPDSGVPLPRPSAVRPVQGRTNVWEGRCEACNRWRTLKKTKRGWNWYRHWLVDHADLVEERTKALRKTNTFEEMQLSGATGMIKPAGAPDVNEEEVEVAEKINPKLLINNTIIREKLELFARSDLPESIEVILTHLKSTQNAKDIQVLVNTTAKTGESLLMISASQGQDSIVGLLLNLGADPNTSGPDGKTALDFATDAGYFTVGRQLVNGGADPSKSYIFKKVFSNEREYAGECSVSAEPKLISGGIDSTNLNPLSKLVLNGDLAGARDILEKTDIGSSPAVKIDQQDPEDDLNAGNAALLLASLNGNQEMMDLLIRHGADINTTSKRGWTPLMTAVRRNDEECVNFLLRNGADVNHLSPDRWTALAEATTKGNIRIMQALLNAEADPDTRSQYDWNPLMHAAYQGDLAAVDLLLEAGAPIDSISLHDETVMLLAAACGSVSVVKRLLEAGCAPESIWSKKAVVVESVPIDNNQDAASSSVPVNKEEAATREQDKLPIVEREQQQQLRMERVFTVGWTPMMVAAQIGNLKIIIMLLNAGANPECKSPMFKTALEIAKETGHVHIVEYLERE